MLFGCLSFLQRIFQHHHFLVEFVLHLCGGVHLCGRGTNCLFELEHAVRSMLDGVYLLHQFAKFGKVLVVEDLLLRSTFDLCAHRIGAIGGSLGSSSEH